MDFPCGEAPLCILIVALAAGGTLFWSHHVSVEELQKIHNVNVRMELLAIIPPAILFFALQRELVAGLTSGAVQG